MKHHRLWRFLLFLAVLILPVIGIVVQTRKIEQEEEMKARAEERNRADAEVSREAADFGAAMYQKIENVRLTEKDSMATGIPQSAEVRLVFKIASGGHIAWPWDTRQEKPLPLMEDPAFAAAMEEARRTRPTDINHAVGLYRALIESDGNPRQRAAARLALGQLLARDGRQDEAQRAYLELLNLPWHLTDEWGEPVAQYAAQHLARRGTQADFAGQVKRALESQRAVTPGENRLLLRILEVLRNSDNPAVRRYVAAEIERIASRIRRMEALSKLPGAAALQKEFRGLGVKKSVWRRFQEPGGEVWLIGMADDSFGLALDAEAIRQSVASSRELRFRLSSGGGGKPLGSHFPEMTAVPEAPLGFLASSEPPANSSRLYRMWLWVTPVTLLGGYLLWRDMRREIRVSEMRSQFVSSVSHELKTPLTAIRMFAETLQMGGADAETQEEYLETIVNESERLTRLLNNVLDFSRIERGQKTYTMEPIPLAEVVDAAARTMRYPLAEKGFLLSVDVNEGIPPVTADRDALQQALLNLLTNAMKYSGKRRDIELRLTAENGRAAIAVTDHGIGVPVEEQRRIFEKFYRAHVPENKAIAGTGLGLALVAHVAEAHGGNVRVESAGEGSTFSILLPFGGEAA